MADEENIGVGVLPRCNWAGLYNFGDSNSDTGGISATFVPITSPYGMSFFKKPSGRLSNGRLLFEFLAEYIGLPYVSAYLDTIKTDYRHGVNFATRGSTIRRQNETIFQNGVSSFSLDIQTTQFTQFKARIINLCSSGHPAADASQLQRPDDFSKALFTIDIGQNDLSIIFRTLTKQQLGAAIPKIINEFVTSVQMITKSFEDYHEHRIRLLSLLWVIATHFEAYCHPRLYDDLEQLFHGFVVFFTFVLHQQSKLVMDYGMWAF